MQEISTKVQNSVEKFVSWKIKFGNSSYDKDDLLDSKFGLFSKKLFYRNKLLGAPFAALLLLLETFFPSTIKFFSDKRREPIADAHFALGYLNLYKRTKDKKYLLLAESHLEFLDQVSVSGYSGMCWGYSKGWQTPWGLWPANTPCITITPYCYWAYKSHHELTGNEKSKVSCKSIADFVKNDLKEVQMPNGTFSAQYSTRDSKGTVVNSTAYRAALLLDASIWFENESYRRDADRNLEFILSYQEENGSWPYFVVNPESAMIDNFHTVFVLKNLYCIYNLTKDNRVKESVINGYDYYEKELLYPDGRPKHFSKKALLKFRKYEMYDYAEGIYLGPLIKSVLPKAYSQSLKMAEDLIDNFQRPKGHFVTRITTFNTTHKVPYLRWPQAQLFHSLTSLLLKL